jgi:hypothetical protein
MGLNFFQFGALQLNYVVQIGLLITKPAQWCQSLSQVAYLCFNSSCLLRVLSPIVTEVC